MPAAGEAVQTARSYFFSISPSYNHAVQTRQGGFSFTETEQNIL
jgi:hypothetical protein